MESPNETQSRRRHQQHHSPNAGRVFGAVEDGRKTKSME